MKGFMKFLHKKNSGKIAKERLKTLLTCERSECSEDMLELMKNDLISSLSKYMDIDTAHVKISVSRDMSDGLDGIPIQRCSYLEASIPILTGKGNYVQKL